ncbi:hypothetical protein AKJ48_00125 [candidate division MSBL1 archaeon SCGC-AAA261O19]|uniref:Uncharacterized protein n=1 Tax=candidate division MSBL1 archaeon SCGC-AAA261O19 TaxID=1698277 RepID=A0A133VF88_9EURY|nr:hypothetical protein AKJ48_00125 [candidate division MSBL1 archaeon SCGC-AAA261O19]
MRLKTLKYRITRGQKLECGCAPMKDPATIPGEGILHPTPRILFKKASGTQDAFSWPTPASKFMALLITFSLVVGMMLVFTPSASAAPGDTSENIGATMKSGENQHGYSLILLGSTITRVQIFVSHKTPRAEINVRELEAPRLELKIYPPLHNRFLRSPPILRRIMRYSVQQSNSKYRNLGWNRMGLVRIPSSYLD